MRLPRNRAFASVRCFSKFVSLLLLLELRFVQGKPTPCAFINYHGAFRQQHDQELHPSVVIPVLSSKAITTSAATDTRTTAPSKSSSQLTRCRITRMFLSDNDEDMKESTCATSSLNDTSSRWVGNFKPPIQKLSEIGKAKKHAIHVTVQNETKVLLKKKYESIQHVLVKAVLWKLFYDEYEHLDIEKDIGDPNYLPDVIALDMSIIDDQDTSIDDCNSDNAVRTHQRQQQQSSPLFWGESGRMTLEKARELCQRYPTTHIVWMRWGIPMQEFAKLAAPALAPVTANRQGRFTLAALPNKNVWELFDYNPINEECRVLVGKGDVEWFEMDDYVKVKSS